MAEFSIYETKARLSEVLRLVKARREVVITERGRPIAKIVPFDGEDGDSLDRRVERLAASEQLAPASVLAGEPLPPSRKGAGALQRFLADRDE
jgi:prevent-host-death family protein